MPPNEAQYKLAGRTLSILGYVWSAGWILAGVSLQPWARGGRAIDPLGSAVGQVFGIILLAPAVLGLTLILPGRRIEAGRKGDLLAIAPLLCLVAAWLLTVCALASPSIFENLYSLPVVSDSGRIVTLLVGLLATGLLGVPTAVVARETFLVPVADAPTLDSSRGWHAIYVVPLASLVLLYAFPPAPGPPPSRDEVLQRQMRIPLGKRETWAVLAEVVADERIPKFARSTSAADERRRSMSSRELKDRGQESIEVINRWLQACRNVGAYEAPPGCAGDELSIGLGLAARVEGAAAVPELKAWVARSSDDHQVACAAVRELGTLGVAVDVATLRRVLDRRFPRAEWCIAALKGAPTAEVVSIVSTYLEGVHDLDDRSEDVTAAFDQLITANTAEGNRVIARLLAASHRLERKYAWMALIARGGPVDESIMREGTPSPEHAEDDYDNNRFVCALFLRTLDKEGKPRPWPMSQDPGCVQPEHVNVVMNLMRQRYGHAVRVVDAGR